MVVRYNKNTHRIKNWPHYTTNNLAILALFEPLSEEDAVARPSVKRDIEEGVDEISLKV